MGCNETATGWDWVDSMLIALEHLKMLVCVCVWCVLHLYHVWLQAPSPFLMLQSKRQTGIINIDGSYLYYFIFGNYYCCDADSHPELGLQPGVSTLVRRRTFVAWSSHGLNLLDLAPLRLIAWCISKVSRYIKSQISPSSHNCLLCQPCIRLEIDDYSALAMLSASINLSATS